MPCPGCLQREGCPPVRHQLFVTSVMNLNVLSCGSTSVGDVQAECMALCEEGELPSCTVGRQERALQPWCCWRWLGCSR